MIVQDYATYYYQSGFTPFIIIIRITLSIMIGQDHCVYYYQSGLKHLLLLIIITPSIIIVWLTDWAEGPVTGWAIKNLSLKLFDGEIWSC